MADWNGLRRLSVFIPAPLWGELRALAQEHALEYGGRASIAAVVVELLRRGIDLRYSEPPDCAEPPDYEVE